MDHGINRRGWIAAMALAGLVLTGPSSFAQAPVVDPSWSVPDLASLPDDEHGRLVRQGHDLITATPGKIGPQASDPAKRYAGNNLACSNCHLDAGRKKFGNPLWGLMDRFPQYSAEAGKTISLPQRVNACMTRSMNGRPLPLDAPEMQAITAYIGFLSTGLPKGEELTGYGAGQMAELVRPADPARGQAVFSQTCASCHGPNGEGVRRDPRAPQLGYMMPPLWGPDSFNDGAGMNRLSTLANFAHNNMPNGTSYLLPRLSPEDAWDVAAFVVSQPRPHKANLQEDFPDRLQKPVDTPYGPYADSFSPEQHIYGPFGPIREELARLKAKAGPTKQMTP
jgi:thiosulfate dehydrogenase